MKQVFMMGMALFMVLGSFACNAQTNNKAEEAKVSDGEKVEVYYFHFTRRCMTCNAVEKETKIALEQLYPQQMEAGKLTFTEVNLDEEGSKAIAKKSQASGQGLIVLKGDQRIDLTSQGFMNARNPEKLQQEIKKAIDPLLASK
ncbi:nitrophenyl compound nitroreductase subunit ArsF family protein [Geofilum rubicundum]|uniref:Thioredoxin domain-containing protein n=1 Tax=Geofilum rubicundum JCM 15548 TaxID=1236989 RepID=A0A0E9LT96_9BACT|nr:nitrophenyl compound nitroreductase subunit ArsF family protein [Geofilum rubicundum]GAO28464.1 hypothetical protein JCM15548_1561 [Geofilum rubicundum JCM 15548]